MVNEIKEEKNIVEKAREIKFNRSTEENILSKIKKEGVNTTTPDFIGIMPTKDIKRKYYYELLKDKILGENPDMMDIIIDHIEELRGRISCHAFLISDKGEELGELRIYNVLVEDRPMIREFWVGKKVDKSGFDSELASFKTIISGNKGGNVEGRIYPERRGIISDVKTIYTFA
jgi:hypothetical protein